jgi:hypothetical protein
MWLSKSTNRSSSRRWFLSRGEVPAARKDCPALDVV